MYHPGLQTNVNRFGYDFSDNSGFVVFPPYTCCDMSGCIAFFATVDPDVRKIQTYSGDRPDTLYEKIDGKWQAWDCRPRSQNSPRL